MAKLFDEHNLNLKLLLDTYTSQHHEDDSVRFEFDYFLNLTKQKQADADYLLNLVKQLKTCVHILDPKLFETNLINMMFFDLKWYLYHSNNQELVNDLCDLLIDLNSAYTSLIYKCTTMLIKLFQVTKVQDNTINCEVVYSFAHTILAALVKIAPTSKINIVKQIDLLYPYMTKDTNIQEAYIRNVLKISEYIKDIRLSLFEICIQKMLKIDVNCTREQIIQAELKAEPESTEKPINHMNSGLADRLDVMMLKLFEYIQSNCYSKDKELDWETCRTIYKDLLFIFDKYILHTYGSSHVQFLLFYICSMKPMLAEGFLDYLWKRFTNPASCAVTRQICSYYIGSLLSRAKYISLNTCVASIQLMVIWTHNYINRTSNNYSNFDLHRTFYTLTQTLFYVIIFRHRSLFQESQLELLNLIQSWKLNDIINSKLNPLLYCLPTVRNKFARITYTNQVAYCYSILDSNNRISLPIVSSTKSHGLKRSFFQTDESFSNGLSNKKNEKSNENPLDSFFPFDPYLLKRSKQFIESIYQEYSQDEMDMSSDEESDSSEESNDESDDEATTSSESSSDDEIIKKRKKGVTNNSNFDDSDVDDDF